MYHCIHRKKLNDALIEKMKCDSSTTLIRSIASAAWQPAASAKSL